MEPIDAFVLELGLDPKNFTDGQRKALESFRKTREAIETDANETERVAKRAMAFATQLRNQIILLYGAFTAGRGIKEFMQDITDTNASLGRLAFTLDTSAGQLSQWVVAGSMVGASTDDISGSIKNLVTQFQEFSITGQSSVIPWFRALGVAMVDANGRIRPFQQVLLDIATKFQHMDPARAAVFGAHMGLGPGMVNLLIHGPEFVKKMLEIGQHYAPTDRDIQASLKLQMALFKLRAASEKLGIVLLTAVGPQLDEFIDDLTGLAGWFVAHPDALEDVASGLAAIAAVITVGLTASVLSSTASGLLAVAKVLGLIAAAAPAAAAAEGAGTTGVAGAAAGGAALAGRGLLGRLGIVGLVTAALAPFFRGQAEKIVHEGNAPRGLDLWLRNLFGTAAGTTGTAGTAGTAGTTGTAVPPEARNFLDHLAAGESAGAYNVEYGGKYFSDYSHHPNAANPILSGPNKGKTSTAAGRYQMLYGTWMTAAKALGLKDFSPANQDRAAWWLAQRDYHSRTGRDLLSDIRANNPRLNAKIDAALNRTWTSLPGGIEAHGRVAGGNVSHSRNYTFGNVTIVTQATDPAGIARDFMAQMEAQGLALQGDYGAQ